MILRCVVCVCVACCEVSDYSSEILMLSLILLFVFQNIVLQATPGRIRDSAVKKVDDTVDDIKVCYI